MSTYSDDELAKLRQRVDLHPTNLLYRFELGEALVSRLDYVAAIPELQKGICYPQVRLRAMALLAEVFDAKGMKDTARKMRERIAEESGNDGDSGSASVLVPKPPFKPIDSASAEKEIPNDDEDAA